jgi:hypothetical protein
MRLNRTTARQAFHRNGWSYWTDETAETIQVGNLETPDQVGERRWNLERTLIKTGKRLAGQL